MEIGRRIFYDKITGNKLKDTGEHSGLVLPSSVEKDVLDYKELSERNRDTFDYIELEFGAYAQDFAESNGYRVNPITKTLEFSYPDPNAPEEPPVFQRPLTEQVTELKQQQVTTNRLVTENGTAQQDLLELLIQMGVI